MELPKWFIEALGNTIQSELVIKSPIITGNMKTHISVVDKKEDEITICIDAKTFDMKEWRKSGKFIYDGRYNYAEIVNRKGKSAKWVDRVLEDICSSVGKALLEGIFEGCEVEIINEL